MDESIIADSMPIFNIVLISLIFYGVGNVVYNTVVTIGSNIVSLIILLSVVLVYTIFMYYVFFIVIYSLELAWITEWVYWASIAIISGLYLKFSDWKKHLNIK